MSNLNVVEFADPRGKHGLSGVIPLPPLATQNVTFTGTAAASNAFNAATGVIRVVSDADCAIRVAADPTAVVTDLFLKADVPEYFSVTAGHKISAIEV